MDKLWNVKLKRPKSFFFDFSVAVPLTGALTKIVLGVAKDLGRNPLSKKT